MKKIPLTKGQFAIVDDEDYEKIKNIKWYTHAPRKNGKLYVAAKSNRLLMHRIIMNAPKDMQVDHINGNGLDNRKSNLRLCYATENKRNCGKRSCNTSGFKGVSWHRASNKWGAYISHNKRQLHLGLFLSPTEAARAYDAACKKLHGKFANLNFKGE